MPKIAREALEERRAHIVAAAMRVFAEKGLSKVTLRDVFKEADMSAGAVYNYFRSKDEIILAVTEAGMREALAAFDTKDAESGRLEQIIEHFFEALESSAGTQAPRVDIMIVAEALANPAVHRSVIRNRSAVKTALTRLVERKQATTLGWRQHPAPVIAELLYTTYQGLVMSLALGEEVDVAAVGSALKTMRFA